MAWNVQRLRSLSQRSKSAAVYFLPFLLSHFRDFLIVSIIPILSWKQAAERLSANQLRAKGNCEYIPHFYTDQPHWYALCVHGDAMVSSNGSKSFHEGDFIIVDTDKEVKHGDFVVAVLPNAKEAIFKQYVMDGGVKYLKPLNAQYPLITMDNKTVILGVMVSCIN